MDVDVWRSSRNFMSARNVVFEQKKRRYEELQRQQRQEEEERQRRQRERQLRDKKLRLIEQQRENEEWLNRQLHQHGSA